MRPMYLRPKAEVYHLECGYSVRIVARMLGVSKSTAGRWILSQGVIHPRKPRRRSEPRVTADMVAAIAKSRPFATCQELRADIRDVHGVVVSVSTILRRRKQSGATFKRAARSSNVERPSADHPFMACDDPYSGDVIAVDETCMVSSATPLYGWARSGEAVQKPSPRRRTTVSCLLAVDRAGTVLRATRKGAFDGESFATFLRLLPPRKVILIDNVGFHGSAPVRAAALEKGHVLRFTPPYCPWFNPVEHVFSCCKAVFRRRRFELRDEAFSAAVDASFDAISPTQCDGAFRGAKSKWLSELEFLRAACGGQAHCPGAVPDLKRAAMAAKSLWRGELECALAACRGLKTSKRRVRSKPRPCRPTKRPRLL